jgi:hypothetical protein
MMRGWAAWSRGEENRSGQLGGKTEDSAQATREEKKNLSFFRCLYNSNQILNLKTDLNFK